MTTAIEQPYVDRVECYTTQKQLMIVTEAFYDGVSRLDSS